MGKRAVGWLLCAALLLAAPFGALASGPYHMAGFDGDESRHVWEDNAFFTRMEARTGVTFTFEEYTDYGKWQAAKQAMLAGDALPDVLFKAALTTREQIELSAQGKLVDLLPLLPAHAPTLWALLSSHPDWLSALTLPDGKVVALPAIYETPTQNAMWINGDWLDALGLAAPTDLATLAAAVPAAEKQEQEEQSAADASGEQAPAQDAPAADAAEGEQFSGQVQNDLVAFLREELASVRKDVTDLTVKLAAETEKREAVAAVVKPMEDLVRTSVNRLRVALGEAKADLAHLAGDALLAEHGRLSGLFAEKFKAGGVAAVAPVTAASAGVANPVRAAQIRSVKLK